MMDETECAQMADFLSIALEEMERDNTESARYFVEDVYAELMEAADE
jgi:hypothetical protein